MLTLTSGVFRYNSNVLQPAQINIGYNNLVPGREFEISNVADAGLVIKIDGKNIHENVKKSLCFIIVSYRDLIDKPARHAAVTTFINSFAEARIEQCDAWLKAYNDDRKPEPICPVIVITDFNLLNYLPDSNKKQNKRLHKEFINHVLNVDKRINFLDGSVWHRMTSVETIINTGGESLKEIINYHLRLYQLNKDYFNIPSTIEYLHLSSRMQQQNYLTPTKEGGHSTFVVPFISHSETRMHHNINRILLDLNGHNSILQTIRSQESVPDRLQWKLLIIDDKYNLLKKDIISQWLNEIGTCEDNQTKFSVDDGTTLFNTRREDGQKVGAIYRQCITFVQHPEEKIESVVERVARDKGSYDIILLDYLLGEISENSERRDYGHRFIKLINDLFKIQLDRKDEERLNNLFKTYNLGNINTHEKRQTSKVHELEHLKRSGIADSAATIGSLENELQYLTLKLAALTPREMYDKLAKFKNNKAPFDRFWIFPISVHNTALLETLKEEGIEFNNPNWYISRGGDPINTPYLFLYNLLSLMEFQVKEAYLDHKELQAHLNDFLRSIKATDKWPVIESKARAAVNRFMHRFGTFEMLDSDTEKGSLLANSLQKSNNQNDHFLYSTIRNFLYILGYRSYRNLLELLNAGETIITSLVRNGEGSEIKMNVNHFLNLIRKQYAEQYTDI